ncbi:MAG: 5-formyltetrahydrofolate cyclo-ligase [Ruminococcaceae bacterium]|nr:5-formyltetrahydrofolate cyclo-ligase [Oscillospiraceae bacterium]
MKKELRDKYKNLRCRPSKREEDEKIFFHLKSFLSKEVPSGVLIYVSSPAETDTHSIINWLLEKGICVAVPKCVGKDMIFCKIESLEELTQGYMGIYEPKDLDKKVDTSLYSICVVPALSVALNGTRLGYGGGFYDRFLASYKGTKLSVCPDCCICDNLPTEKHDVKMDLYITQSGVKKVV